MPGLSIAVLGSGKKVWRYYRRLSGGAGFLKKTLGQFPAFSIADARAWAKAFNDQIDAGIDPREAKAEEQRRTTMTVARAHGLYMEAVGESRASRAKRMNKPRTIKDKLGICRCDIAPKLAKKIIFIQIEANRWGFTIQLTHRLQDLKETTSKTRF